MAEYEALASGKTLPPPPLTPPKVASAEGKKAGKSVEKVSKLKKSIFGKKAAKTMSTASVSHEAKTPPVKSAVTPVKPKKKFFGKKTDKTKSSTTVSKEEKTAPGKSTEQPAKPKEKKKWFGKKADRTQSSPTVSKEEKNPAGNSAEPTKKKKLFGKKTEKTMSSTSMSKENKEKDRKNKRGKKAQKSVLTTFSTSMSDTEIKKRPKKKAAKFLKPPPDYLGLKKLPPCFPGVKPFYDRGINGNLMTLNEIEFGGPNSPPDGRMEHPYTGLKAREKCAIHCFLYIFGTFCLLFCPFVLWYVVIKVYFPEDDFFPKTIEDDWTWEIDDQL